MSDIDFATLEAQLLKLSAKVDGKTAVFYSGFDPNGMKNFTNALACVDRYPNGYYTLGQTQVGAFLENVLELRRITNYELR